MLKLIAWTISLGAIGALGGFVYSQSVPKVYESRATSAALSPTEPQPDAAAVTLLRQPQLQAQASSETGVSPLEVKAANDPASKLVILTVRASNPEAAHRYAARLLNDFSARAAENNQKLTASKRTALETRFKAAQAALNKAESQITAAKQASGILDIDSTVQQAATYQSLLSQQHNAASQDLASLNSQISSEMAELAKIPGTTIGKVTRTANPVLKAYNDQLLELQKKKIGLLATWLPTAAPVQAVDAQINAVKQEIAAAQVPNLTVETQETAPNPVVETLKQEIAQQKAQLASDAASIKAIELTIAKTAADNKALPAAQGQMIQLVRARDEAQKETAAAQDALDSLGLTGAAGQMPTLTTVLPPVAIPRPVWPDQSLLISVGAAIGLVLGACIGWAGMERGVAFQPVTLGPQAFPMPTQAAALAPQTFAPPLPGRRGSTLSALVSGGTPAESYRYMVYALSAKHPDLSRSILFTGVSSDELCSEAAAQFAIAMAETGIRTLLADINLRRSDLTAAFGGQGKSGISDMLSRTMLPTPARDLLLETPHEGLVFLPCGSEDASGLGGCHNLQIAGLMEDFDNKADIRIYNTAPCTAAADAPRLVRYVDDVWLVASAADEAKGLVGRAKEIMTNAGAKNIEVILVDAKRSRESFVG